ncbi:MAG TPA: tripartite tricarboxylate transporter substrate-binding protein, partial [Burkholderiales bacterium]|nr:tripartite tricarboxylate transporter substrate-binding protein [Burkholderiales bacterium]
MRDAATSLARTIVLMLLFTAIAAAQPYPSKPVRIIVPYGAGGAVDIVARALGQELTKRLGQTVIVDNRTGAGGNIASDLVAKSAADGYTLLMASPANAINATLYTKLPYNPATDLTPIALVGYAPTILLAGMSFPAKNVAE